MMPRRRGKPKGPVSDVQHDAPNLGRPMRTIENEPPLEAAQRPDLMLPIVLPPPGSRANVAVGGGLSVLGFVRYLLRRR